MDNKVVQTLARAFVQLGYTQRCASTSAASARSAGAWDEGRGEIDDALAVVAGRSASRRRSRWCWPAFRSAATSPSQAAARLAAAGAAPSAWCWSARRCSSFDVAAGAGRHAGRSTARADDVVPLAAVFDWARPQALPVTVVPGAGHFFHGQLPLLKHLVIGAWLRPDAAPRCAGTIPAMKRLLASLLLRRCLRPRPPSPRRRSRPRSRRASTC